VNGEAIRLAPHIDCWTRAAIARRLAEHVLDGASLLTASLRIVEEVRTSRGVVVPISRIGDVPSGEVSIAGTVSVLWEPSSEAIQQVGLIEDESGRTKFTVWKASRAPMVDVGERVVLRSVAKSWYQGRYSVAVTGWSEMFFPERP
jgi:ssDNA-binding replication factor A large subunit